MDNNIPFKWIPFYEEFANKLLTYKDDRSELIRQLAEVFKLAGLEFPNVTSKGAGILPEEIDPFTVFAMFNRGIKVETRALIASKIKEVFQIQAAAPVKFEAVPESLNQNMTFYWPFYSSGENDKGIFKQDIDVMWILFDAALKFAGEENNDQYREDFIQAFNEGQKVKGVAYGKLTMGLYYIRPMNFLSLDSTMKGYLLHSGEFPELSKKDFQTPMSGESYLKIEDYVESRLETSNGLPENFPELSYNAWYSNENHIDPDKPPVLPDDGDGKNPDAGIKEKNYWLYSPGTLASLWPECKTKSVMMLGYGEIGNPKGLDKQQIIERLKEAGQKDINYNIQANAIFQFWNEVHPGDVVFAKKGRSTIIGKGIVGDEIWFDSDAPNEFKSFRAVNWVSETSFEVGKMMAMKTLTRITDDLGLVNLINSHFEELEQTEGEESEPEREYPVYSEADFLKEAYLSESEYSDLKYLIDEKKNVILQGPPGVGKTFIAKRLAYSIMGRKDPERVLMVQFHQRYSYEDFVMGYRPNASGFELKEGPFYEFCQKARENQEQKYFVIIDEMNRGNLNRIFGELFMLMESDKRDEKIRLLYGDRVFSVPKNIYFIGLMNTADRSLASLDYALRRRFYFFTVRPKFDSEGFKKYLEDLEDERVKRLSAVIQEINNEIEDDPSLGEGFLIGHSYLSSLSKEKLKSGVLHRIVDYELIPLLKEYWYDEPSKVREWSKALKDAIAADDTNS